jgi:hypothetical protein
MCQIVNKRLVPVFFFNLIDRNCTYLFFLFYVMKLLVKSPIFDIQGLLFPHYMKLMLTLDLLKYQKWWSQEHGSDQALILWLEMAVNIKMPHLKVFGISISHQTTPLTLWSQEAWIHLISQVCTKTDNITWLCHFRSLLSKVIYETFCRKHCKERGATVITHFWVILKFTFFLNKNKKIK